VILKYHKALDRAIFRRLAIPRAIVSALRTAAYGTVVAVFGTTHAQAVEMVEATLVGAVLGDSITWFVMTILLLPRHIKHGGYDVVLMALFAVFFLHSLDVQPNPGAEFTAVAFLALFVVLGLKILWYGVSYLQDEQTI